MNTMPSNSYTYLQIEIWDYIANKKLVELPAHIRTAAIVYYVNHMYGNATDRNRTLFTIYPLQYRNKNGFQIKITRKTCIISEN